MHAHVHFHTYLKFCDPRAVPVWHVGPLGKELPLWPPCQRGGVRGVSRKVWWARDWCGGWGITPSPCKDFLDLPLHRRTLKEKKEKMKCYYYTSQLTPLLLIKNCFCFFLTYWKKVFISINFLPPYVCAPHFLNFLSLWKEPGPESNPRHYFLQLCNLTPDIYSGEIVLMSYFCPDVMALTVQRGQIHSPLGISGSGGFRQWMW